MLKTEIYKFVSSINIIDVNLVELLKSSFIYMRNKVDPRMETSGTSQVILQ